MGKYFDELAKSAAINPDKPATRQDILNVLGEFLQESIQMLRENREKVEPKKNKQPKYFAKRISCSRCLDSDGDV